MGAMKCPPGSLILLLLNSASLNRATSVESRPEKSGLHQGNLPCITPQIHQQLPRFGPLARENGKKYLQARRNSSQPGQ
jgi:hypothetical protein